MPRKVSEINRYAVFAWSPTVNAPGSPLKGPFIATGTVTDRSTLDPCLEIYNLENNAETEGKPLTPLCAVSTNAIFKAIFWGNAIEGKPLGVIVGVLADNTVRIWDPAAVLQNQDEGTILFKHDNDGLCCLDINSANNMLAVAAGSKVFTWDLANPSNMKTHEIEELEGMHIMDISWNIKTPRIISITAKENQVAIYDVDKNRAVVTLPQESVSKCIWNPADGAQFITAAKRDGIPVISLWDIRKFQKGPIKIMQGHQRGVTDLSWCGHDSALLLSCDEDGKTLMWNMQQDHNDTLVGLVSEGKGKTLKTSWCPSNPNLVASAVASEITSGDKAVRVYAPFEGPIRSFQLDDSVDKAQNDGDCFDVLAKNPGFGSGSDSAPLIMKSPPKWLQVPVGAAFGFGGKLVTFKNAKKPSAENPDKFVFDVQLAITTVETNPEITTRYNELQSTSIQDLISKGLSSYDEGDQTDWKVLQAISSENPDEKLMAYLGYSKEDNALIDGVSEMNLQEPEQAVPVDSTLLNGDEDDVFAQFDAGAKPVGNTIDLSSQVPLELFTNDGNDAITRAVILGDFESAVKECLSVGRLADALFLAIQGGSDLISRTQKLYLEQKPEKTSYERLVESVVQKDLLSVVQQSSLADWQSVLVFLFTHATKDEVSDLCVALGSRLESSQSALDSKRHATTCYLAARNLEKATQIWAEEQKRSPDYVESLHRLMEKITVFREAISKNSVLDTASQHLSIVNDKYSEYAIVLANQGNVTAAYEYVKLIPADYKETDKRLKYIEDLAVGTAQSALPPVNSSSNGPITYGAIPSSNIYNQPAVNTYGQPAVNSYNQPAPNTFGQPLNTMRPLPVTNAYAPQLGNPNVSQNDTMPPVGPPPKANTKAESAWNDIPKLPERQRTPVNKTAVGNNKPPPNTRPPMATMSPFGGVTPNYGFSSRASPFSAQPSAFPSQPQQNLSSQGPPPSKLPNQAGQPGLYNPPTGAVSPRQANQTSSFGATSFGAFGQGQSPATGFGQPPPAGSFGPTGFGATNFGATGFGATGFGATGFGASGFGQQPTGGYGQPPATAPTPAAALPPPPKGAAPPRRTR